MTRFLLALVLLLFPCFSFAQKSTARAPAPHEHFSKQLLNLENELEELRLILDEEEHRVRLSINKKIQGIYALKQKQRTAQDPSVEEKNKINAEIEQISKAVQEDRVKLIGTISNVEKKRKEIFSLKMNIDEWVTKIEATEISVIERIEKIKKEINAMIQQMKSDFAS